MDKGLKSKWALLLGGYLKSKNSWLKLGISLQCFRRTALQIPKGKTPQAASSWKEAKGFLTYDSSEFHSNATCHQGSSVEWQECLCSHLTANSPNLQSSGIPRCGVQLVGHLWVMGQASVPPNNPVKLLIHMGSWTPFACSLKSPAPHIRWLRIVCSTVRGNPALMPKL